MFFAVRDLEVRKIPFRQSYRAGHFDFLDPAIRVLDSLVAEGVAELVAPIDEIRVRGTISGTLECDCDRCLEPFPFPVNGAFDLVYCPAEAEVTGGEAAIAAADADVGYYEGAGLDLADAVREQVLLWLPMQRRCGEDCKGICLVCGRNRNKEECGCPQVPKDPRWAALQKLTGD